TKVDASNRPIAIAPSRPAMIRALPLIVVLSSGRCAYWTSPAFAGKASLADSSAFPRRIKAMSSPKSVGRCQSARPEQQTAARCPDVLGEMGSAHSAEGAAPVQAAKRAQPPRPQASETERDVIGA